MISPKVSSAKLNVAGNFQEYEVEFSEGEFNGQAPSSETTSWKKAFRYSDFSELHSFLQEKFPKVELPDFPGKVFFGSHSTEVTEKRREAFQALLTVALADPSISSSKGFKRFISQPKKSRTVPELSNSNTNSNSSLDSDSDANSSSNTNTKVALKTVDQEHKANFGEKAGVEKTKVVEPVVKESMNISTIDKQSYLNTNISLEKRKGKKKSGINIYWKVIGLVTIAAAFWRLRTRQLQIRQ